MFAASVVITRAIQSGQTYEEIGPMLQTEHPQIFEAMMQYQSYLDYLLESDDEYLDLIKVTMENSERVLSEDKVTSEDEE